MLADAQAERAEVAVGGGGLARDRSSAAQRLALQRLLGAALVDATSAAATAQQSSHTFDRESSGVMPWECVLVLLDMARDGVFAAAEFNQRGADAGDGTAQVRTPLLYACGIDDRWKMVGRF